MKHLLGAGSVCLICKLLQLLDISTVLEDFQRKFYIFIRRTALALRLLNRLVIGPADFDEAHGNEVHINLIQYVRFKDLIGIVLSNAFLDEIMKRFKPHAVRDLRISSHDIQLLDLGFYRLREFRQVI